MGTKDTVKSKSLFLGCQWHVVIWNPGSFGAFTCIHMLVFQIWTIDLLVGESHI